MAGRLEALSAKAVATFICLMSTYSKFYLSEEISGRGRAAFLLIRPYGERTHLDGQKS